MTKSDLINMGFYPTPPSPPPFGDTHKEVFIAGVALYKNNQRAANGEALYLAIDNGSKACLWTEEQPSLAQHFADEFVLDGPQTLETHITEFYKKRGGRGEQSFLDYPTAL